MSFRESFFAPIIFILDQWNFQLATRVGQIVEHHVACSKGGMPPSCFLADEGDVVVVQQVTAKNHASRVGPSADQGVNLTVESGSLGIPSTVFFIDHRESSGSGGFEFLGENLLQHFGELVPGQVFLYRDLHGR